MQEYSRTFTFKDDKSDKFWTIEVRGTDFTVTFGRTGSAGQQSSKTFADEGACKKAADKLIAEKTSKGYMEKISDAADSTQSVDTKQSADAKSSTGSTQPVNSTPSGLLSKSLAAISSANAANSTATVPAAIQLMPGGITGGGSPPLRGGAEDPRSGAGAGGSDCKQSAAAPLIPLEVLQCYVALYLESKEMKRLFGAERIRAMLDERDMTVLTGRLWEDWLASGADAKTKGMMTLYAIHGGDAAVRELKAKVKEFDFASRSAMAGDAVRAIAVSDSPAALVTVDTLGRTYQNKLVRRMAAEALEEAAKLQGITVEELADKIVPNLGLDEKGELHLATNTRSWTAHIGADLKITLYNSEGKKISALPAMAKDEDEAQYAAAKEELSLLKKELRSVVSGQSQRLELILSSGRGWNKAAFEDLFMKNPVMAVFATSLVFGIYTAAGSGPTLVATFRYNGDGTCSGPDDNSFTIPEDAEIRLVHPLHLRGELKARWKAQLADYEISQPFPQLDRKIYAATGAEQTQTEYIRFKGTYVNGGGFVRRLFKAQWRRGDLGDAGSYYSVEKPWGEYLVEVHFGDIDDFCVGNEFDTNIELTSLTFTRSADKREMPLGEVPSELYSEAVYIVEAAIAAAQVKEEE